MTKTKYLKTRKEQIASGVEITPLTREEQALAGNAITPITEKERFYQKAYSGGGSGRLNNAYVKFEFTYGEGVDTDCVLNFQPSAIVIKNNEFVPFGDPKNDSYIVAYSDNDHAYVLQLTVNAYSENKDYSYVISSEDAEFEDTGDGETYYADISYPTAGDYVFRITISEPESGGSEE